MPLVGVSPVERPILAAGSSGEGGDTSAVEGEDAYFYKPPAGWSVERVVQEEVELPSGGMPLELEPEVDGNGFPFSARRQFSDDSALDFDPREEFAGRRPGYVYGLGSKGLGYYEDKRL